MPTTRSSKRPSEAFASLPEPAKRSRKRKSPMPAPILPMSPEPDGLQQQQSLDNIPLQDPQEPAPKKVKTPEKNTLKKDAHTQTDDVVYILTARQLDARIEELIERNASSNKRARADDDLSNTPPAKRANLTSATVSGYEFLFDPPKTAPVRRSQPLSSTPGRIVRGPASGRITPMNKHRKLPSSKSIGRKTSSRQPLVNLKPIELPQPPAPPARSSTGDAEESGDENSSPTKQPESPPVRRSIFGSLRGLAQSGLELAMNLSPMRKRSASAAAARPALAANTFSPDDSQDSMDVVRSESRGRSPLANDNSVTVAHHNNSPTIPQLYPYPTYSRYDHLHFIKPGSDEERALKAGNMISPPRPASPPDEFESAKKRNPNMPDDMIRSLIARRTKRKAMQGLDRRDTTPPKVAPLFGPNSHYARGTVDPRFTSPGAYRMFAKYPNFAGGSLSTKRTRDDFEADTGIAANNRQPTVEDDDDAGIEAERPAAAVSDDNDDVPETPLAKKQKIMAPATPRSALKKQGDFSASVGRSGRSVNFKANPVSGSRGLRAHYGPAGQYKGSTFADLSSPTSNDESTLSTVPHDDFISPSTKQNTLQNTVLSRIDAMLALEKNLGADIPEIDFTMRDPDHPTWRPTLSNPRPGCFRVPDDDEYDTDTDEGESEVEIAITKPDPPQPSTPRMSHAELPAAAPTPSTIGVSFNESSIQSESTELALEKARSRAQKYKPKDSSRLSEVSLSHSRSPSPDSDETPRPKKVTAPAVQPVDTLPPSWRSRTQYVEPPLDRVHQGEDGMTDYEREHQYDDWAASLPWDKPQTYEEAGTGTKEIQDLIRKNWTEEDSRRSEEFWQHEFDTIDVLQQKAKAQGQLLQFITGMEDADSIMG